MIDLLGDPCFCVKSTGIELVARPAIPKHRAVAKPEAEMRRMRMRSVMMTSLKAMMTSALTP